MLRFCNLLPAALVLACLSPGLCFAQGPWHLQDRGDAPPGVIGMRDAVEGEAIAAIEGAEFQHGGEIGAAEDDIGLPAQPVAWDKYIGTPNDDIVDFVAVDVAGTGH